MKAGDTVRVHGAAIGKVVHEPLNGIVAVDFGKDGIYSNEERYCEVLDRDAEIDAITEEIWNRVQALMDEHFPGKRDLPKRTPDIDHLIKADLRAFVAKKFED